MITSISGSIEVPAQVFNGIWIQSIQVTAPAVNKPIVATIRVCPFNSDTGEIATTLSKTIYIRDVTAKSVEMPSLGSAMNSIFIAVQDLVNSGSLFI
jgi:hypothetical protein